MPFVCTSCQSVRLSVRRLCRLSASPSAWSVCLSDCQYVNVIIARFPNKVSNSTKKRGFVILHEELTFNVPLILFVREVIFLCRQNTANSRGFSRGLRLLRLFWPPNCPECIEGQHTTRKLVMGTRICAVGEVASGTVAAVSTMYMALENSSKILAKNIANNTVMIVSHK